ncbi:MAG: FG-GAP-like repeat-containing protein [candidate division WOR-3 bacterium]
MVVWLLFVFCDVTPQSGLLGVSGIRSVAFCDYDGDGDLDIVAGSPDDGGTRFLRNKGGKFVDATAEETGGAVPGLLGLLAWDMDYDGAFEIIGASSHLGSPIVFMKRKAGTFRDISGEMGFTGDRSTRRLIPIDVNCDGRLDLLELNTSLINEPGHRLWVSGPNGFRNETPPELASLSADGFSALAIDLNRDLYPDIILSQKDEGILVIKGSKEDMGRLSFSAGASETRGVIAGDYDGDGFYDLFVCSEDGGHLLANRSGGFQDITQELWLSGLPPLRDGIFADVDLDGLEDLLLITKEGKIILMINEDGLFVDRTSSWGLDAFTGARTLAVGDYDSDGDPDIALVANGSLRLLENITARGNYIKVRIKGPAPGDRITLYSQDLIRTTQVGASINSLSMGSPDIIFGLGDREQVDSIIALWSCDGGKNIIRKPKLASVVELSSGRVKPAQSEPELSDTSIKLIPNPAFGTAGIIYIIEKPSWAEIRVVESSGKTIKVLDRGQMEPGTYWVSWDGMDESGRKMPKGIYFVNLTVGESSCQKKLVWFPY